MDKGNVSLPKGWTVTYDQKTRMYVAKSPDGNAQVTYPEQEIGKIMVNGKPVNPTISERIGEQHWYGDDPDRYEISGLMGATFTLRDGAHQAGVNAFHCEDSTFDVMNGTRHDGVHVYGGSGNVVKGDPTDYINVNCKTKHPNRNGIEYQ